MALPSTKKKQTSPCSPSLTPPLLSNFPLGIWAILGLLNLIDESVDIVEDEVLPGKIANVIALAINHIKDDDSEECW